MAITFPTTLDALTNPTSTSKENVVSHADQHSNANDILEALEAKVGVDNSAVVTTIDYKLKNTVGGHDHDGINSKSITIPQQDHAGLSNLDYASAGHTGFEATIGHTTENVANKDTDGTLAANSDTKYPSQKAVKTYADTADALKEVLTNKSTGTSLGTSDTLYPTQNAVKTYADTKIAKTTNITSLNEAGIADGEVAVFNLTSKDIRTSNVTIATTLGTDDTTIPTSAAVKTVTDALAVTNYTWQGAWVTSTAYAVNDLVENSGSAYICISAHTSGASTEPGVGASWTTVWDLMVQEGAQFTTTAKCKVYLNSAQDNLVDSTETTVTLNAEVYDPGSNFDTSTYTFTAPVTGYYMISGSAGFQNGITDKRYNVEILVNGAIVAYSTEVPGVATAFRVPISTIEYVVAGQAIIMKVVSFAGANTVDLIATSSSTYLCIHLLST